MLIVGTYRNDFIFYMNSKVNNFFNLELLTMKYIIWGICRYVIN
jgi:hypothetical protein